MRTIHADARVMSERGFTHTPIVSLRKARTCSTTRLVSGFTLIELLVVIAIIGILSAVVLASLNTARNNANDAARMQDIKAVKTAMELYYIDNNTYPQYLTEGAGYGITNLSSYLVPKYIASIPALLVSDGDAYVYRTIGGNGYGIRVITSSGACKTGVNIQSGWWGAGTLECNF